MARISIDDCLDKIENRFSLVLVAADRAKQLMRNADPLVRCSNKEAVTALREIAAGAVIMGDNSRKKEEEAEEVEPKEAKETKEATDSKT